MPILFIMTRPKRMPENRTSALKTKATTPIKTINRKIIKNRANVKSLIKYGEDNLKVNSIDKQNLKSGRELSANMRKMVDSTSRLKINRSKAQCRTTEIKEQTDEVTNKVVEIKTTNDLVMNTRKKTTENKTKNLLGKNKQNSTKNKCSSNTIDDKSVLDVRSSNEMQNLFLNKAPHARTNRNKKIANTVDKQSPIKIKRCLVRLQRTPTEKNISVLASAPLTNRKCLKRLTQTPNTVETRQIFGKFSDPAVRLKKIAIKDSVTSNFCFNTPVIADNKRKNFRKLSLTKSFNIFEDNNSKGAETSKAATKLNEENQSNKEKNLPKKKNSVIKQIEKLSLKGRVSETDKKKKTIFKDLQFGDQLESSIRFNPVRNSTLIEFDKQKENLNETTKINLPSKHRSSFQNFANKSNEIENLLNTLDEEEEIFLNSEKSNENNIQMTEDFRGKHEETHSNISKNNKTNKFFHYKIQNTTTKGLNDNLKNQNVTSKRNLLKRRSTEVKRDNIYEFFSQSQTSDSDGAKHIDPTADIVKKLINEGKVQVATNFKGKGKPKLKPDVRPQNRRKHTVGKKLNQLKKRKQGKKVTFLENRNDCVEEEQYDNDHFDNDHLDNDEEFGNLGYEKKSQRRNILSNTKNIHKSKNHVNDQEGTFSSLARTVLINQTDRSNSKRKIQSELLEKVRNIISTPKNKKSVLPQTDLSPIAMPFDSKQNQKPSPWRVSKDACLPTTFSFCRSSGNLPSFSSDFIPSTPRKQKPQNYSNALNDTFEKSSIKGIHNTNVILSPLINSIENIQNQFSNSNEPTTISSFSSNDSNAENMPPSKPASAIQNENETIFDSKQLPNPRRALKNRSPLKTINILEVVHLPPYKNLNKITKPDDINAEQVEMFGFEENLDESNREDHSNRILNTQLHNDKSKNLTKLPGEDLFGFEEYLSQTDISSQENVILDTNKTKNTTIQDKLQCLGKLKPPENDLEKSIKQNSKKNIQTNITIFNDDVLKDCGMRQRDIKDMLCSTLLDMRPSTSKDALNRLNKDKLKNAKRPNFGQDVNVSELFADPEPETTFNESEVHRTYIRPHKRKRRLKENNFVLESGESEEEDNSAEQQQIQQCRDSENTHKRKRQLKFHKDEVALIEFIKEFNELCKEVESHELVVEKSA